MILNGNDTAIFQALQFLQATEKSLPELRSIQSTSKIKTKFEIVLKSIWTRCSKLRNRVLSELNLGQFKTP